MDDMMQLFGLRAYVDRAGERLLIGKLNVLTIVVKENRSGLGPDYLAYVSRFVDMKELRLVCRSKSAESAQESREHTCLGR